MCYVDEFFRKNAGEYNQKKSDDFDKIHTKNRMNKVYSHDQIFVNRCWWRKKRDNMIITRAPF